MSGHAGKQSSPSSDGVNMLTAFHVRSIKELGARQSRQECILGYDDKLLVSLANGTLRIYRVTPPPLPPPPPSSENTSSIPKDPAAPVKIECLREIESFSKRPVVQMDFVGNILVVLADNYVTLYDRSTYDKIEQLSKTKGATVFAVVYNGNDGNSDDEDVEGSGERAAVSSNGVGKLAVVVKRRLLVYTIRGTEVGEPKEMTLPAQPRCLVWVNDKDGGVRLCTGSSSSFSMVDVEKETVAEIGTVSGSGGGSAGGYLGWATKSPMATNVGRGELLLARDSTSMYVSTQGEPINNKASVGWTHAPEFLGYSYPFLVSHHPKHVLEIRNPQSQSLLQSITLPNSSMVYTPRPEVPLVKSSKQFYVASPTQIWLLMLVDFAEQLKELTVKGEFDEAISLLELLDTSLLGSREVKLKEIQMLKAGRLFEEGKYRASMELFADISAPPERVIRLFPPSIAGELSRFAKNDSLNDKHDDVPDTASALHDYVNGNSHIDIKVDESDKDTGGEQPMTKMEPKPLEDDKTHDHLKINGTSRKAMSDTASIRSVRTDNGALPAKSTDNKKKKVTVKKVLPLEGHAFKTAVEELSSYLADIRRRLSRFLEPDMEFPSSDTKSLSKPDNDTDFISDQDLSEVTILLPSTQDNTDYRSQLEQLYEIAQLVDTTLLRAYMLANTSLVKHLVRLKNFCDPKVVHEKLVETGRFKELVDYLMNKRLHRDALALLRDLGDGDEPDEREPELHGSQPTVSYLQKLPVDQLPLVFEYLAWVLETDPDLGMQVFTEDTAQAEAYPRAEVCEYLERIDVKLAVQYVEHIIDELKDDSPEFHNWLIRGYLDMMIEEKSQNIERQKEDEGDIDEENSVEVDEEGEWPWKMDPEERRFQGEKLLRFLEQSQQYWPEKVLRWLPKDDPDFYEARATVLSKMGGHREALEIYVYKLGDHEKAETYCNRVHHSLPLSHDPAETHTETVYHTLLSLYLSPPPGSPIQLDPALHLLSRHGARLSPSDTLKLIPESLKMADLESYFENRIRHANSRVNLNRIMANLRKTELVRWNEKLMDVKGKKVRVGEERVCPVCHKRLGRSVISVFPSGEVVHYGCGNKLKGGDGSGSGGGGARKGLMS